ncbi:MAG: hypothetical protein QOE93_210 [Actinomycetota bacterium]|jgi:hypothetical protein|nr:hypothetical protein [Actinomycetota bacterium]
MGSYDKKLAEGAQPFLDEGEQILAAFIARPRGWTQAMAGRHTLGIAQHLGSGKMQDADEGARAGGFGLASPMALAVTQRRLLSLEIGSPIGMGIGGKVKGLAGAAPLTDVESIEVKRLAAGKTVTVTVNGSPFTLEVNAAADVKGLVSAFEQAKSG